MKVLYLAPPRSRLGSLTAFAHNDEEIRGLAGAGVDALVLSPAVEQRVDARR